MPLTIGLMSGTSRDGMDAALLSSDGLDDIDCGASLTLPYASDFTAELAELCALGEDAFKTQTQSQTQTQMLVKRVGVRLTHYANEAVSELLASERDLDLRSISVLGFHGHTVCHSPHLGKSLQIGDGGLLAALSGITVVDDFRSCDLSYGGEGAPLAPLYHLALARCLRKNMGKSKSNSKSAYYTELLRTHRELDLQPIVFLNLGGISNVTWIAADGAADLAGSMLAFDCGPCNALLDDWVCAHSASAGGRVFDEDGIFSSRGDCKEEQLSELLRSRYFSRPPPKSLDRDEFSLDALSGLSLEDGARTLSVFIAESIKTASHFFPRPAGLWLLCGGGRRNATLVEALRARLTGNVCLIDDFGFDGDALEAQAFGYLALRRLRGYATSYPQLTGCSKASSGGRIHKAK